MAVTLKDIASKLGLSIMTVSRALNDHPDINDKTKQLVLKAAKELHYTPNIIARNLVRKRSNTLGILIYDLMDTFYIELLNGAEEVLRKNNYNILLCNSHNDPELEYKSIRTLLENRVAGIIICPTEKNNQNFKILKNSGIPCVFINFPSDSFECNYVSNDESHGAYLAINYLINKGYEKIYYIYSNTHTVGCRRRIEGCKKAFKENNLSLNELGMLYCERKVDMFYDITMKEINYRGKRIGIHVWDDQMTVGVYKAIIDKGLKIPEEVGLVGCDDIESSKYLPIPLTTLHSSPYNIGKKTAEVIIKRIKSKDLSKTDRIILKPRLVIRGTA